jgi:putative chitinase
MATFEAQIKLDADVLFTLFHAVNPKRGKQNKLDNLGGFVETFNAYADYFGIDNALETRHFIAQIAHESDQWNAYEEYASGEAYEGRKDLGNTHPGDGVRFKGRSPIQTTGRTNYRTAGEEILKLPFLTDAEKALFEDDNLLNQPKLLESPKFGTLAALIYWVSKDINTLCQPDDVKVTIKRYDGSKWYNYSCFPIEAVTRKVNGGVNGLAERTAYYQELGKIIA